MPPPRPLLMPRSTAPMVRVLRAVLQRRVWGRWEVGDVIIALCVALLVVWAWLVLDALLVRPSGEPLLPTISRKVMAD